MLLRLAFLNLLRNPRRSLITVISVSLGLATIIFLWAFLDGYQENQRSNAINLFTAHIQIERTSFRERYAADLTLQPSEALTRARNSELVAAATERVLAEGLVGTSENSRGVLLIGVDPQHEPEVTSILSRAQNGSRFSSADAREVMIGTRLAKRIGAELGTKIAVMAQSFDGSIGGLSLRIIDTFETGTSLDENCVLMPIAAAEHMLDIGDKVHVVALRLRDRGDIAAYRTEHEQKLNAESVELVPWDSIIPEIEQWAKFTENITHLSLIMVLIVISVGVMNTILMGVFERTKEIGVMQALGTPPGHIVTLVFFETFFLEVIGVTLGLCLGYLATAYFARSGIPIHGFDEAARHSFMSPVVFPLFSWQRTRSAIEVLMIVGSLCSLYPATRASRSEPLKALSHG